MNRYYDSKTFLGFWIIVSLISKIIAMTNNTIKIFTLLVATVCIFSCTKWDGDIIIPAVKVKSDTNNSSNNDGTLFSVYMTDAPTNVEEVNVDLELVVIKGNGGGDTIQLGTNAGIYNLLDFQNGIDTLIASSMVSVDTVKQVRLVLGDNNTIKVDGVLHDLITPSAQQSGLKVNVNLPLDSIDFYNLLIDFDAEESVKQQGNGNYMLKPVLKVL